MVLQMRGTVTSANPWDVMVDLFFYREPEEAKEPEQEAAAGASTEFPAAEMGFTAGVDPNLMAAPAPGAFGYEAAPVPGAMAGFEAAAPPQAGFEAAAPPPMQVPGGFQQMDSSGFGAQY